MTIPTERAEPKGRARIAARLVGGLTPLDSEVLIAVLESIAVDRQLVDEWLGSGPTAHDVVPVLTLQLPASRALDQYATWLGEDFDRDAIWLALERQGVPGDLMRAVGKHGVTKVVVDAMAPRVLEGSTQEKRDAQVRRLLTANLANPEARKAAANLAERLVEGRAGDAVLAADIVVHTGGVPHGYVTRLRAEFDRVVAENSRRIPSETQKRLLSLNLLTPPKKGLGRFFGRA